MSARRMTRSAAVGEDGAARSSAVFEETRAATGPPARGEVHARLRLQAQGKDMEQHGSKASAGAGDASACKGVAEDLTVEPVEINEHGTRALVERGGALTLARERHGLPLERR